MGIVYRIKKGSPLSAKELDNNFHELDQRVTTLEQQHTDKIGWGGQIELRGHDLVFLGPTQEVLSQIKLPLPRFCPRGQWKAQQSYAGYDVVTTGKQAYCCVKAHQSALEFALDHDKWQLLLDLS